MSIQITWSGADRFLLSFLLWAWGNLILKDGERYPRPAVLRSGKSHREDLYFRLQFFPSLWNSLIPELKWVVTTCKFNLHWPRGKGFWSFVIIPFENRIKYQIYLINALRSWPVYIQLLANRCACDLLCFPCRWGVGVWGYCIRYSFLFPFFFLFNLSLSLRADYFRCFASVEKEDHMGSGELVKWVLWAALYHRHSYLQHILSCNFSVVPVMYNEVLSEETTKVWN